MVVLFKFSPNHSTNYSVIRFFDCKNFVVQNGSIVGDAMNHDYSPVIYKSKEYKTSHEWGYGIYCSGSTGASLEYENLLYDWRWAICGQYVSR